MLHFYYWIIILLIHFSVNKKFCLRFAAWLLMRSLRLNVHFSYHVCNVVETPFAPAPCTIIITLIDIFFRFIHQGWPDPRQKAGVPLCRTSSISRALLKHNAVHERLNTNVIHSTCTRCFTYFIAYENKTVHLITLINDSDLSIVKEAYTLLHVDLTSDIFDNPEKLKQWG